MTTASLDRLLAALVVAMAATGLLSLRAGAPGDAWLFVVHGVLAGALALAVALKVGRSVPRAVGERRTGRLALGLLVSLVAAAALSGGYVWVASGELLWVDVPAVGRWTVLTLHAWVGLVLVPLVVVHVLPRRWRLLRPGPQAVERARARIVSRRAFVVGGGLALAGAAGWLSAGAVEALRGGTRRFTGSRWLPAGGVPIPTTFFGEGTPAIDLAAWRLRVGDREWTLEELRALGEERMTAILDCTSGWAIETTWVGVPLAQVLDASGVALPATAGVDVRSVTGWSTSLSAWDARRCLLAWSVAGQPLPADNGAPLRLVAPDRRGLEWVKWVASVQVT